ncbi:hypothetical protein [Caldimonas sp. KR1-144]|uniref:hypothetical protein n=1 Tax=Caldimonas sp. KR1-144 TaxID=3400911 RepID=UPI003BFB9635
MTKLIRVFGLYRIKSNALRRLTIVVTLPLLFIWNITLMLLGVAMFWWQNQRELFRSAAHYWKTSERIPEDVS